MKIIGNFTCEIIKAGTVHKSSLYLINILTIFEVPAAFLMSLSAEFASIFYKIKNK